VDVERFAERLTTELRAAATPERATKERAYLKSDLAFLGASVPVIRKATGTTLRTQPVTRHEELIELVNELWGARIHELRMAAVEILELRQDLLVPQDRPLLERLLREARTWALVDGLAVSVIGALLDRHPEVGDWLAVWSTDEDMWVRRASLLAYLPGLRRGEGDFEAFAATADRLLDEREFFIRKAIGWVLRESGKRHPGPVIAWLEPRARRASGVTLREAVKHLPIEDRERILSLRDGRDR
jgi:3-methyladenine DNA glycosylase AlkD